MTSDGIFFTSHWGEKYKNRFSQQPTWKCGFIQEMQYLHPPHSGVLRYFHGSSDSCKLEMEEIWLFMLPRTDMETQLLLPARLRTRQRERSHRLRPLSDSCLITGSHTCGHREATGSG